MSRKMALFISSCLIFFTNSLLLLFRFMALHVLRTSPPREDSESLQPERVSKVQHKDGMEENEEKSFSFKSQFHIPNDKENPVTVMEENDSSLTSAVIHNHQFGSKKANSGYMKKPKAMIIQAHESLFWFEECGLDEDRDTRCLSTEDFQKIDDDRSLDMLQLKKRIIEEEKYNSVCSETSSVGERRDSFIMEEFSGFDSGSESSSDGYSERELAIDSDNDNIKSDGYYGDCELNSEFREASRNNIDEFVEGIKELLFSEKNEEEVEEDYSDDKREEYKIEPLTFAINDSGSLDNIREAVSGQKSVSFDKDEIGKSSNKDLSHPLYVSNEKQQAMDGYGTEIKLPKLVEERFKNTCSLDFDEEKVDELWEHQDLIEQLKVELREVRAAGLPTILEESESLREIKDPNPFNIDKDLLLEGHMKELHKFFKCYEEKMRKFDNMNFQKMYATGFLHLNDPIELRKTLRPIFLTIISHLSQNLLPFCIKRSDHNPSDSFIKELRCDLETVYVGQTCLSWEYLRWQYENLHELSDSGSSMSHQYNNVAEKFQQLNVTLQRFVENESFQGPRIASYVKQRCILRNFLQIPVVKEDCLIYNQEKRNDKDVITRKKLVDIMEESMRVYWEFVKSEKLETSRFFKSLVDNLVELHDPSYQHLLADIQEDLQKKVKKLKDLMKAGNCMVKKFKKSQEQRSNQEFFFCQVDLKLVSRVLSMSRITSDQLIWCQKKLSKITFSGRKVHREPSILLFPC